MYFSNQNLLIFQAGKVSGAAKMARGAMEINLAIVNLATVTVETAINLATVVVNLAIVTTTATVAVILATVAVNLATVTTTEIDATTNITTTEIQTISLETTIIIATTSTTATASSSEKNLAVFTNFCLKLIFFNREENCWYSQVAIRV